MFKIAFSPCPNDTFIFDALVNKKLNIKETYDFELFDIQALNTLALTNTFDIIKISYALLPYINNNYDLLEVGGALGKGVGPLLVSNDITIDMTNSNINVALPGKQTTANYLFDYLYPHHKVKKHFMVFSEIMDAIKQGKVNAGVVIHEGRFTYKTKGLTLLADLGEMWEEKTKLPLPLGCLVIKKTLSQQYKKMVEEQLRQSIDFAYLHYPNLSNFVIDNAQEMDKDVMLSHINLYVNEYSKHLDADALKAINILFNLSK